MLGSCYALRYVLRSCVLCRSCTQVLWGTAGRKDLTLNKRQKVGSTKDTAQSVLFRHPSRRKSRKAAIPAKRSPGFRFEGSSLASPRSYYTTSPLTYQEVLEYTRTPFDMQGGLGYSRNALNIKGKPELYKVSLIRFTSTASNANTNTTDVHSNIELT